MRRILMAAPEECVYVPGISVKLITHSINTPGLFYVLQSMTSLERENYQQLVNNPALLPTCTKELNYKLRFP